jgi:hypothetical protein
MTLLVFEKKIRFCRSQTKRGKTTIVPIGLRGTARIMLVTPAAALRTV